MCFGLQTLSSIDFSNLFQLKGLKPKNKGHTNLYECYDLTKKVYLMRTLCKSSVNLHCANLVWKKNQYYEDHSNLKAPDNQGLAVVWNGNFLYLFPFCVFAIFQDFYLHSRYIVPILRYLTWFLWKTFYWNFFKGRIDN